MTRERGRDPEGDGVRRLALPAEMVRVGDTVVFRSKLEQEYRFVVDDIDSTWITFETKQMVHRDRFERDAFRVVRPMAAVSSSGRSGEDSATESVSTAPEGESRPSKEHSDSVRENDDEDLPASTTEPN